MDGSGKTTTLLCFGLFVLLAKAEGFCWKPDTSPFYGPPTVTRAMGGNWARVDWDHIFNDGPQCAAVDFFVMTYPRNSPSDYTLSEFTGQGLRSTTVQLEGDGDFVFQVVAREDKGETYGIDYKYSDMVTSYGLKRGQDPGRDVSSRPYQKKTNDQPAAVVRDVDSQPASYPENPWYIYECLPFLKDIEGFPEASGFPEDESIAHSPSQNQALLAFIKHTNQNPIKMVEEFLQDKRRKGRSPCNSSAERDFMPAGQGYASRCTNNDFMCCATPWGLQQDCSGCFKDYFECGGGKCVPLEWQNDGWPDCLDGSDERTDDKESVISFLPQQLICVQCAGVILSAGFICRESHGGLTNQCLENVMGKGACNSCIKLYLNLP